MGRDGVDLAATSGPRPAGEVRPRAGAFDDTDVDDVTRDSSLTFVLDFVRITLLTEAGTAAARAASGLDDHRWWDVAGPLLATYADADTYPVAS